MGFLFILYRGGCGTALLKPLRTMQTYLTQMLGNKLGGYLVTNIFELRRDKHSTSTTKKYVMDTGLLIALITLLGGGFIIILKKKKR